MTKAGRWCRLVESRSIDLVAFVARFGDLQKVQGGTLKPPWLPGSRGRNEGWDPANCRRRRIDDGRTRLDAAKPASRCKMQGVDEVSTMRMMQREGDVTVFRCRAPIEIGASCFESVPSISYLSAAPAFEPVPLLTERCGGRRAQHNTRTHERNGPSLDSGSPARTTRRRRESKNSRCWMMEGCMVRDKKQWRPGVTMMEVGGTRYKALQCRAKMGSDEGGPGQGRGGRAG